MSYKEYRVLIDSLTEIGKTTVDDFYLISKYFVWISIPFCAVVSWAFHTMERLARTGENPFEGGSNDVPISTISRGIEIDLRQMLDEDLDDIPCQFPEDKNVQM